ncbi:MAG: VWA domain-containing protein [Planctomycetota bacterium]
MLSVVLAETSTPVFLTNARKLVAARGGAFIAAFIVVIAVIVVQGAAHAAQQESRYAKFDDWFRRYKSKQIYYDVSAGRAASGCEIDRMGPGGLLQQAFSECIQIPTRDSARRLLDVASFYFIEDEFTESQQFAAYAPVCVREAATAALGSLTSRDAADFLATDVLLDRSASPPARRAAAVRALGIIKDTKTKLAVFAAASDPSPMVRAAAMGAAVEIGGVRPSSICAWLAEPEPETKIAALNAASKFIVKITDPADRESVITGVRALLTDTNYQIRARAIEILVAAPSRDSIPALIAGMERENLNIPLGTGRKRILLKFGEALERITGMGIPADDPARWAEWWTSVYLKFRLGDQVAGRPVTAASHENYFTIPIKTDRMVFLIDVSRSMDEPSGSPPAGPKLIKPANPKSWTKLEKVKNELLRLVRELNNSDHFDIIAFSGEPKAAFSQLRRATKENKKAAEKFLIQQIASGETALYEAFAAAFQNSSDGPDTLFVLTDGESTAGSVSLPGDLEKRVATLNPERAVEIHTIFAGTPGSAGAQGELLLERIAKNHKGEFRRVQ